MNTISKTLRKCGEGRREIGLREGKEGGRLFGEKEERERGRGRRHMMS